jgi:hypothetical protein
MLQWEGGKCRGGERINAKVKYGGESVTDQRTYRHGPVNGLLSVA